jgi:hypothetical protein
LGGWANSFSRARVPNVPLGRLGELLLERGSEGLITDEELFDPGEWEEMFNDEKFARHLGVMHPEWDLPPTR